MRCASNGSRGGAGLARFPEPCKKFLRPGGLAVVRRCHAHVRCWRSRPQGDHGGTDSRRSASVSMPTTTLSQRLYERAAALIPGGVNSPVRAWRAVGGQPLFIQRAQGCNVWDADGRMYVDYVGSWGPMILGHAHPQVLTAIQTALRDGTSFGAPTEREVELAEALAKALPSIEMVRLVSSGTEAAMTAIRLARGYTGRAKILKFSGCYHGHADALLVRAGSGAATFGVPDSAGVPEAVASQTLVAEFNDVHSVHACLDAEGRTYRCRHHRAGGRQHGVDPAGARLSRSATDRDQPGWRATDLRRGDHRIPARPTAGCRTQLGIDPDLTVLGKIVGGGLPLAAFGGKRTIMEQLAPLGPVYQAGTLSGNPLAVAAGLQTLALLAKTGTYETTRGLGAQLEAGLRTALATLRTHRVSTALARCGRCSSVPRWCATRRRPRRATPELLRPLVPRHVGRGIYLALAVRGGVHLAGAWRGGYRGHGACRRRGDGDAEIRGDAINLDLKAARFMALGMEFAITVVAGVISGYYLTCGLGTAPLVTLLPTLGGMGGALYRLIWNLNQSRERVGRRPRSAAGSGPRRRGRGPPGGGSEKRTLAAEALAAARTWKPAAATHRGADHRKDAGRRPLQSDDGD